MNIIYCIHGLKNSGGMERVITVKANYLTETFGYNVTIITLNTSDVSFFDLNEKIKIIALDQNKMNQVIQFVNDMQPDVFISTGGKEISILPYISRRIMKVVEVHFCFYYPILREVAAGRNFIFRAYAALKLLRYILFLNFSDVVVSLTEKDACKWRRCLLISKTRAIGNPVPFISHRQFFLPQSDAKHDNKFIAIGRLDNQKGFHDLINICSILVNEHCCRNWTLEIYGQGDLYSELEDEIKKECLQEWIKIIPPVNDLSFVYLNAKALLMTSYYEGMPMVMLEALSFGLPCISFDCDSGPSDLLMHESNGFLISERNCNDFALKMKEVIDMNCHVLAKMGASAVKNIQQYRIEKILSVWDDLFRGK